MNQYTTKTNALDDKFRQIVGGDEEYDQFSIRLDDNRLCQMLIDNLNKDVSFWNQAPWKLQETDEKNTKFLLGEQTAGNDMDGASNVDNRLFVAVRAILSYGTGRMSIPEVAPSRSDSKFTKAAKNIELALYQDALDRQHDIIFRTAAQHLLTRKRGYLKLRFDPEDGIYGGVVTECIDPSDIVVDKNAIFGRQPERIYQRCRCSVEELTVKFPNKKDEIYNAMGIKQGRYSQTSKFVTYFECWFSYFENGKKNYAVAWFMEDSRLVLDKMKNPNWIYTGDDKNDRITNVLSSPPTPYIDFTYMNGTSAIDETCLLEQAIPLQKQLNERTKQFNENVSLMNGRWIANSKAFTESDVVKLISRGSKSIGMTSAEDVNKAIAVLNTNPMPVQVYQSLSDSRNEIDTIMGVPSVFRGGQPDQQNTLGRDMMVKQQAGMLQDDFVRAISNAAERYYMLKLHMWRVYYVDDYWFQVKGADGKFIFIMLNGDVIDSNVKVGIQVDSSLPIDRAQVRSLAMQLARLGKIDDLSLFEDLGLPNPDLRAERLQISKLDPAKYAKDIENDIASNNAEVDIDILIAGKEPEERDDYDADYLNSFNKFMTTNRFNKLSVEVQQKLVTFLAAVQHIATNSLNLSAATQQPEMPAQPVGEQPPMPGEPPINRNVAQ